MPETPLTVTTAPGAYASAMTAVTMGAADIGNGNSFVATNNDLILAWNDSATPYTVTITSQPDGKGRLGTITTQAIAADVHLILGPMKTPGWADSGGLINVSANNASVKFGIINL
ncbi:hypothetical protein LCGC14_3090300 [marine sediment metagenome]|uniref:Uncharacterized protein n=1 Tax=marine sediment metagenome TaxID=412755 RepID=A0A0F8WZG3_9ZZZZ